MGEMDKPACKLGICFPDVKDTSHLFPRVSIFCFCFCFFFQRISSYVEISFWRVQIQKYPSWHREEHVALEDEISQKRKMKVESYFFPAFTLLSF